MSDCEATQHRPGPPTADGRDVYYADCRVCGLLLWTFWCDYDGDGAGHWTRWKPAPARVIA